MLSTERYRQAKNITLLGALINTILGALKLAGGLLFHSHALFADGIHSFSDLFTDMMVLFASKFGSQSADDSHPYGHQRIETAATLMLALLLILAGAGIGWDAFNELIYVTAPFPDWQALPIALLSLLANELLFHYTYYIGKKIESALVLANAWHHRSDAAASFVVAVGLIGSLLGWSYLDACAAIIVGLLIIKMGLDYGWNSVKELIDTAVDLKTLKEIEAVIQGVEGVEKIHQLRSRSMGGDILIDVHILVSPFISVSEGHYIAQHVHQALITQFASVTDVTVHVDPEDDEIVCPSLHLPNRKQLEEAFLSAWQQTYPSIESWVLHYVEGKISLDLIMNCPEEERRIASQAFLSELNNHPYIYQLRLLKPSLEK